MAMTIKLTFSCFLTLLWAATVMISFRTMAVFAQVPIPERMAQVESRQGNLQSQIDRNNSDISLLRMEIEEDRSRIADQNGRIATIEGIGEGLGALVVLLQLFNIMQATKRGGSV